jgi:hypothetical protein
MPDIGILLMLRQDQGESQSYALPFGCELFEVLALILGSV